MLTFILPNCFHFCFQMRFIGSVTTHYPIPTSAPAKDSGKLMGKEGTKQLPWKLPAIIGGPILVGLGKQDT